MKALRPVLAAVFAVSLAAPLAAASEASPTAEELLAALSYDPKKASTPAPVAIVKPTAKKRTSKPLVSKETVERKDGVPETPFEPVSTRLRSMEAKPAAKANEKEKEPEPKREARALKGKVVTLYKGTLSVEFAVSEEAGMEEMLLTLDKDTKFAKVASAKALKYGDEVAVDYEVAYHEIVKGDGTKEPHYIGTVAKKVTLVRTAEDAKKVLRGANEE